MVLLFFIFIFCRGRSGVVRYLYFVGRRQHLKLAFVCNNLLQSRLLRELESSLAFALGLQYRLGYTLVAISIELIKPSGTNYLFFYILFIILALLFSLPPNRNSDPGSHGRLFPPPRSALRFAPCVFISREDDCSPFLRCPLASNCAYSR